MSKKTRQEPPILKCALGEIWLGRHDKCRAEVARICGVPIDEVPLPDYSKYAVWKQMPLLEVA